MTLLPPTIVLSAGAVISFDISVRYPYVIVTLPVNRVEYCAAVIVALVLVLLEIIRSFQTREAKGLNSSTASCNILSFALLPLKVAPIISPTFVEVINVDNLARYANVIEASPTYFVESGFA
jgi:hypothetical protein